MKIPTERQLQLARGWLNDLPEQILNSGDWKFLQLLAMYGEYARRSRLGGFDSEEEFE